LIKTSVPFAETVGIFADRVWYGYLGTVRPGGTMAMDLQTQQKQAAAQFWKSYFAKFRRQSEDQDESRTGVATISQGSDSAYLLVDRRRSGARPGIHQRR
jgi:hypothetical protein